MFLTSVNLIPEAPVATMVDLARQAEELGYHRCWVFDEGLATRDLYVTMAAVAGATERILIGPGITNPYTRHPAITAAAIASLDEMSGGRGFLGVGAGGSLTLGPLGLPRTRPLAAVGEMIQVCRALFSGNAVDLSGATTSLHRARLGFARPDLEIWLAGRGPKMVEMGGELADGVMLEFLHHDLISEAVDLVRRGAARSGRPGRIAYGTMVVTDDASMEVTRRHMTYRLVDSSPVVRERLGIGEAEIEKIRAALPDGLEAAGRHVRREWVEPFVIAGSVAECADRLVDLMEQHRFEEFVVPVLDVASATDLMATVARLVPAR